MASRKKVTRRIIAAVLLLLLAGTVLVGVSWWRAHRQEAKFRKAGVTELLENKPGWHPWDAPIVADAAAVEYYLHVLKNEPKVTQTLWAKVYPKLPARLQAKSPKPVDQYYRRSVALSQLRFAHSYPEDAVAIVIGLVRDEDENPRVRAFAVETLGFMGAKSKDADLALQTIIETAREEQTEIRRVAYHAMIRFTNRLETVVPILVAALGDSPKVRDESLNSLRYLGPEAVDMISRMPAETLPMPWEELQFQLFNERRWIKR